MFLILKKIFSTLVIFILTIEIVIQSSFLLGLNWFKLPILYYNPYCDQRYWNLSDTKSVSGVGIEEHAILSYKKKELEIPNNLTDKINSKNNKHDLALYGSSYINHKYFKTLLKTKNLSNKNYALDSYGLDQIYLSYKLTSNQNSNKVVIFGFLLEDLDRSLFNKRDYSKVRFVDKNEKLIIKDLPKNNNKIKRSNDFYLYRFVLNFIDLIKYDFDPRQSECKIQFKKKFFRFFIDEIKKETKKFNQKLIVITFNSKADFIDKPTWRYNFIKNELNKNSITHIDALEILANKGNSDLNMIDSFFGNDLHNSKKSFNYILEKAEQSIKQYK